MRISDWSSDVCSSDLDVARLGVDVVLNRHLVPVEAILLVADLLHRRARHLLQQIPSHLGWSTHLAGEHYPIGGCKGLDGNPRIRVMGEEGVRSEEHTSELQSLMRISYAVFCLSKKSNTNHNTTDEYMTKDNSKI